MVIPMITPPRFHTSSSGGGRGEGVLVVPPRCMTLRNRPELWRNLMTSNIFLQVIRRLFPLFPAAQFRQSDVGDK
jgi:hypothetical protein